MIDEYAPLPEWLLRKNDVKMVRLKPHFIYKLIEKRLDRAPNKGEYEIIVHLIKTKYEWIKADFIADLGEEIDKMVKYSLDY